MRAARIAAMALAALSVAACGQAIADKEDLLAAAGFSFRPANTPERAAALRSMPPHKFVYQVRNGQVVWIYADPTVCGCVYVGNQQAYDRYKQEIFQRRIADEQQLAAQMNQQAAWEQMQWSAWGPWAPYYY